MVMVECSVFVVLRVSGLMFSMLFVLFNVCVMVGLLGSVCSMFMCWFFWLGNMKSMFI